MRGVEMLSIDVDVLGIIGGFIFSIIWLVRLEAKVLYLEKALNSHTEYMTKSYNDVKEKLDNISDSLARLEGKLGY